MSETIHPHNIYFGCGVLAASARFLPADTYQACQAYLCQVFIGQVTDEGHV